MASGCAQRPLGSHLVAPRDGARPAGQQPRDHLGARALQELRAEVGDQERVELAERPPVGPGPQAVVLELASRLRAQRLRAGRRRQALEGAEGARRGPSG
eukprot:8815739-Pyramimonas_sp.AAC.1